MPAHGKLNVDVQVQVNEDTQFSSGPESANVSEDEEILQNSRKYCNNNNSSDMLGKLDGNLAEKNSMKRIESLPNKSMHAEFIKECVDTLLNLAVFQATDRSNKVLEWQNPEHLMENFDMSLKDAGDSHEDLLELLKKTIKHSVKTGHPYFVNQLFSGVDPYGLVGQWLTDALNPSVYTYEVSPVFTLMEEVVLKQMREIVGFAGGEGDGIFCPGGSIANGYAISCARFWAAPEIKVCVLIDFFLFVIFF